MIHSRVCASNLNVPKRLSGIALAIDSLSWSLSPTPMMRSARRPSVGALIPGNAQFNESRIFVFNIISYLSDMVYGIQLFCAIKGCIANHHSAIILFNSSTVSQSIKATSTSAFNIPLVLATAAILPSCSFSSLFRSLLAAQSISSASILISWI